MEITQFAPLAASLDKNVFFLSFGLYLVAMVVIGWRVSRGQKSGDDYLLGGRNVPLFLVLGTTIATMVGTGSSMGAVGAAYDDGWAGALFATGGAFALFFLARYFAGARQYKFMTLAEEMSFYYGGSRLIENLVGVAIFFASVGWLGAHILGGSIYLSWVLGIDMTVTANAVMVKGMVALGFTIYVIIGGYTAVVWTDTIQAVILFLGFILMAFFCMDHLGAWEDPGILVSERQFAFLSGESLLPSITLLISMFVSFSIVPSFRQRIYSSRDKATVQKSFVISGILYLLFATIPVIIGITAQHLKPGLPISDQAFPELMAMILPPAIGIIVLIAGLSAVISSASSDAIAGTSILMRDIFHLLTGKMPPKERALTYSRFGAAITSTCAFLFTLLSNNIFDYIKDMVGILMSGMFVSCMFGRFWKRSNWQGGVAALVAGSATAVVVMIVPGWKEAWGGVILPSTAVASVACIITSLMTPPNRVSDEEALTRLDKEREAFSD